MCMGANRPACAQGPHGKRIAFHDKVRSFLKDKQSIGLDSQGIYIYNIYIYIQLSHIHILWISVNCIHRSVRIYQRLSRFVCISCILVIYFRLGDCASRRARCFRKALLSTFKSSIALTLLTVLVCRGRNGELGLQDYADAHPCQIRKANENWIELVFLSILLLRCSVRSDVFSKYV